MLGGKYMAHKNKLHEALDFPESEKRSEKIVELKAWMSELRHNKDDNIKQSSIVNAELIISNDSNLKGTIGYNEFSGHIHLLKNSPWINREAGQWEDSFESALQSYIEKHYNVVFDGTKLHNAVVNVARRNVFNPVKQRIEKQEWDNTSRVETFFIDLLGVDDNLYTREVTKRWIVGSVVRIYNPGIKFELVPILSGKQGIGKSTAPSLLYTDDYFSDTLESLGENKDDYLQLRNNVILELGELASLGKTKITKAKNFISGRYDDIRLPYERNTVKWARHCVFIGTTNDGEYLKDLTGERRFYPLPCRNKPKLNVFKMADDYFLQVLAEAKVLFEQGQRIYFDKGHDEDIEILEIATKYQEEAKVEDPVRDLIIKYLDMEVPADWDEARTWNKRQYYKNYPKGIDDDILKHFAMRDRLIYLESVLTADILEVVFEKDSQELLNSRTGSEAKKISLIIENIDGWEKKRIYERGNKRGFYNKSNALQNKE